VASRWLEMSGRGARPATVERCQQRPASAWARGLRRNGREELRCAGCRRIGVENGHHPLGGQAEASRAAFSTIRWASFKVGVRPFAWDVGIVINNQLRRPGSP